MARMGTRKRVFQKHRAEERQSENSKASLQVNQQRFQSCTRISFEDMQIELLFAMLLTCCKTLFLQGARVAIFPHVVSTAHCSQCWHKLHTANYVQAIGKVNIRRQSRIHNQCKCSHISVAVCGKNNRQTKAQLHNFFSFRKENLVSLSKLCCHSMKSRHQRCFCFQCVRLKIKIR